MQLLLPRLSRLFVLLLALAGLPTLARAVEPPPNIVLIVSDDQGYRDLGCYGSKIVRTPNLDRLAAAGVRLTDFYVPWPACTPSRGSLLTGRYPQRNGLYDMIRNDRVDDGHRYTPEEYAVSPERVLGMDVREVMIPAVLEPAGYRSGVFGKWDGGQLRRFLPLQRGFADFYGFVNTGIDYYTHERYGVPSMYRNNQPTTEDRGTYTTQLFTREALRFLGENRDRPFFLYVPYNAPHIASILQRPRPVQAPPEYLEIYPPGKTEREKRVRAHLAALTCMDEGIGRILDFLDENELAGRTCVIFFSDNGGHGLSDNTPLRGHKGTLYEGGVRVPCIVRFPGRIPAGSVCREFLSSLEVLPTLAKLAGVKPPSGVTLDGFDMLPVLQGKKASPRTKMFWRRRADRAARVGNWKWIDSTRGGGLFDLSRDIGEARDLSTERPKILRKLRDAYAAWQREMEQAEPRGPFRNY